MTHARLTYARLTQARCTALAAATLLAAVGLTGCSDKASSDLTGAAPAKATSPAPAVRIDDAWVRAADSGMTAAFGRLRNTSDSEVTIVSATSPFSTRMELHEVVPGAANTMKMQPKAGGIVIPPGGSHELNPGGDHLMFMSLTKPVKPGDDVTITLTTGTGAAIPVTAAVRAFTGGNEEYVPGGMDMGAGHGTPAPSVAPSGSVTP